MECSGGTEKEERGTRNTHRGPTLHIGGAVICLRWLHAPTSSCGHAYLRGALLLHFSTLDVSVDDDRRLAFVQ